MATNYFIRTKNKTGLAPLFVRVRSRKYNIDFKLASNLEVDIEKWANAQETTAKLGNFRKTAEGKALYLLLDDIAKDLDALVDPDLTESTLTKELARTIIDNIVYREQREKDAARIEAKRLKAIADSRETYVQYVTRFIGEAESGKRKHKKNNVPTLYKPRSITNFKQTLRWLKMYEQHIYTTLHFEDINVAFSEDFIAFMEDADSSINTIGKCIKDIKNFTKSAFLDGKHNNMEYNKFSSFKVDVDTK